MKTVQGGVAALQLERPLDTYSAGEQLAIRFVADLDITLRDFANPRLSGALDRGLRLVMGRAAENVLRFYREDERG